MNDYPSHHALRHRDRISGALLCKSALHIGAGQAADVLTPSDMPLTRDGRGRPYVPGSSFRGVLRSGLESLLRGLGGEGLRVCDPLDKEHSCSEEVKRERAKLKPGELTEERSLSLAWGLSCEVCKLFGHSFFASRVRIADLTLVSDLAEAPVYTRDGVGLDRDLRCAAGGILYNFEALSAAARFDLRMEVDNALDHELGLLLTGLDLFKEGFATLGGKSSRGLGAVDITSLRIVRRTARDYLSGGQGEILAETTIREGARERYAA
jgi:CRISPR-associated RAMP protein (TIGR02581 family)